jgi:hypothetical protein
MARQSWRIITLEGTLRYREVEDEVKGARLEAFCKVRLNALCLFTQMRSEFIYSIPLKPYINFVPLDGAIMIHCAT